MYYKHDFFYWCIFHDVLQACLNFNSFARVEVLERNKTFLPVYKKLKYNLQRQVELFTSQSWNAIYILISWIMLVKSY